MTEMIEEIDLTNYAFNFLGNKITDLKKKNFIYGKNGTGKSSITKAIKEQYGEVYNVQVFDGWQGIIGFNDRLDSIALGTGNASLQEDIEKIDSDIENIMKDIEKPELKDKVNLFVKLEDAKKFSSNQTEKLEKFYTHSAGDITDKLSLGRRYNKNNFKNDINQANRLPDTEIIKLRGTIEAKKIQIENQLTFINIDFSKYFTAVNEILQTAVTPMGIIEELSKNIDKQTFAKEGMNIHSREEHEVCAFCGNEIDVQRWEMLDNYFSDEVKKLDRRIMNGIRFVNEGLNDVEKIQKIKNNQFYPDFNDKINELNMDILAKKEKYKVFLKKLEKALDDKKSKTTIKIEPIQIDIPDDFFLVEEKYLKIYRFNQDYSNNLESEKQSAKNKLRYHEVKEKLEQSDYEGEKIELLKYKVIQQTLQKEYDDKILAKKKSEKKRIELIGKSSSEVVSSKKINDFLKGLGTQSFELDYVQTEGEQKGQYRIKNITGEERSIQTLSEGEKNIVAFLWFINNLEKVNQDEAKNKIVIFDDPMTSNDDNCQYLMMGIIQKFYQDQNHPQMFILTHNNHFYLQVTPSKKKYPTPGKSSNQKYMRLLKNDGKTEVKIIENSRDELKPIYDELWEELKFAYDHHKTIFMWNNMRRILETYNRFNYRQTSPRDIESQFDKITDKALAIGLVKSLHVNSHIGYETDIDISGKTRDDLKILFEIMFEKLGAKKHFETYWQ